MLKRFTQILFLVLLLTMSTAIVQAAPSEKTFFGERNVAIITVATSNFTQKDMNTEIIPYIRAKIRFPEYSIQTNEVWALKANQPKLNDDLAKLAKDRNADILLYIDMPIYEEYITSWFGIDTLHVNVSANIYLYDAQSGKLLDMRKLRSRDAGEYGSVSHPNEVLLQSLNLVLEKLPTNSK